MNPPKCPQYFKVLPKLITSNKLTAEDLILMTKFLSMHCAILNASLIWSAPNFC